MSEGVWEFWVLLGSVRGSPKAGVNRRCLGRFKVCG